MESSERKPKALSPLRTIAITALVTLALSGAAYHYFGAALLNVQRDLAAPSVAGEAQAGRDCLRVPDAPLDRLG